MSVSWCQRLRRKSHPSYHGMYFEKVTVRPEQNLNGGQMDIYHHCRAGCNAELWASTTSIRMMSKPNIICGGKQWLCNNVFYYYLFIFTVKRSLCCFVCLVGWFCVTVFVETHWDSWGYLEATKVTAGKCNVPYYAGKLNHSDFLSLWKKKKKINRYGCYYMALRPSDACINNGNFPCYSLYCM